MTSVGRRDLSSRVHFLPITTTSRNKGRTLSNGSLRTFTQKLETRDTRQKRMETLGRGGSMSCSGMMKADDDDDDRDTV